MDSAASVHPLTVAALFVETGGVDAQARRLAELDAEREELLS